MKIKTVQEIGFSVRKGEYGELLEGIWHFITEYSCWLSTSFREG